jgi:acyl carrier protein
MTQDESAVLIRLRSMLADLTHDDAARTAPPQTPLLRDGIGLDSIGGTMLLTEVQRVFGVDVAGTDLNLDSLVSIGTLAAYIEAATAGRA